MEKRAKQVALIGFLTAMLVVTGMLKLPGVVPGTEFQLSAPIAVGIAATFGFKRYIISGVLASFVSLAFGLQNLLNVAVSMTFRIAAGGLLLLLGNAFFVVIVAGPLGTFCARLVLGALTHTNVWILVGAAAIGMVYTAIVAFPAYKMLTYLAKISGFREFVVPKRSLLQWWMHRKNKKTEEMPHETI